LAKKHPNIPNNPQLFEAFTSQNSSNFPQLTKHSGGKTPPKSPETKKNKTTFQEIVRVSEDFEAEKGSLGSFFFPETEAMLSRNWLKGISGRVSGVLVLETLRVCGNKNRQSSKETKKTGFSEAKN